MIIVYSYQQKGTKAPQAAGKIHTDFEKGFIMAEVMKFSDFKEEGSESAVKVCIYKFITTLKCWSFTNIPLRRKDFSKYVVCCRLRENTDSRAGTTLWRMETLSFSNSTHPMHRRRNPEPNSRDPQHSLQPISS